MTQDVRSKNAAPPDRRADQNRLCAGSRTPALLILRQGISQQDFLTRGQRPQTLPPLTVMMVASAHHFITLASVTGRPKPNLGKTPLTGRAVRLTGATQGGVR